MTNTSPDPEAQAQNHRFVVNRKLRWKGVWYQRASDVNVDAHEVVHEHIQAWIKNGWVCEVLGDGPATPQPLPEKKPTAAVAPILQAVLGELATTLPTTAAPGPVPVRMVPLAFIRPDPTQPRKDFSAESMAELVESIKQHGVEQSILVRPMSRWRQIVSFVAHQWAKKERGEEGYGIAAPFMWERGITVAVGEAMDDAGEWMARLISEGRIEKGDPKGVGYVPTARALAPVSGEGTLPGEEEWLEIVYGERRWRGSERAGLSEIPAKVQELTDIEAAEKQAIENLDRVDLKPMEEASQYDKLLKLPGYGGMPRLIETTGKARNTIYGKLQLLKLPDEARQAVERGDLPAVTAERIGRLEGAVQQKAVKAILHPQGWQQQEGKVLSDRRAKEAIEQATSEVEKERKLQSLKDKTVAAGITWIEEGSKKQKEICGTYGSEPQAKSGYVVLSQHVPGDTQYRSYGDILKLKTVAKHAKKLQPKAATTYYGDLREYFDLAEVREVFKAANWAVPKKQADPAVAKRKANDRIMSTVLDKAADQIRLRSQLFCPRVAQTEDATAMWRALARCAVDGAGHSTLEDFVRRHGLQPITFKGARNQPQPDYPKTMREFLVGKTMTQYAAITAELMLMRQAWWGGYNDFQGVFKDGAADFGIDLKRLLAEAGADADQVKDALEGDDDEDDDDQQDEETAGASARTSDEPAEAVEV